ncbi:MAG: hypothetical protein IT204_02585 [Fimbriimonadaceae bacterium]|nr:hypothetical protein [Fimbriimonadaceae bacterium]
MRANRGIRRSAWQCLALLLAAAGCGAEDRVAEHIWDRVSRAQAVFADGVKYVQSRMYLRASYVVEPAGETAQGPSWQVEVTDLRPANYPRDQLQGGYNVLVFGFDADGQYLGCIASEGARLRDDPLRWVATEPLVFGRGGQVALPAGLSVEEARQRLDRIVVASTPSGYIRASSNPFQMLGSRFLNATAGGRSGTIRFVDGRPAAWPDEGGDEEAAADTGGAPEMLRNPGFEQGLDGWDQDSWRQREDFASVVRGAARHGERCLLIRANEPDDSRATQRVAVRPRTAYRLSGWIRTSNVQSFEQGAIGANLCIWDTDAISEPAVLGSTDWQRVVCRFNSGDATEVMVCARLGHYGNSAVGSAWFDGLSLEVLGD